MDIKQQINYWFESATHDLEVAETLFKNRKYDWCLFIGHLVLEKVLKEFYVRDKQEREKTKLLLENGAYVNVKGNHDETPIHLLAAFEYIPYEEILNIGEMLIQSSADINAKDKDGATPLHWSLGAGEKINWMYCGNSAVTEFLLKREANYRIKDNKGSTPLDLAYQKNKKEVIQLFKRYKMRSFFSIR